MTRRTLAALALACAAVAPARAAILFTPHVSEYAELVRGEYLDTTLIHTSIDKIRNGDGSTEPLGVGAIPPGETIDATLLLVRYLWIGNLFEDTHLPLLADHDQFFRIIGTAGTEKGSGAINDLSREFGQTSSGSGLGDLFLVGGLYGEKYHWGPLKGNGLYALTVKVPIGEYDRNSLLNIGTHYWSASPQLAQHQEWFGKLFVDATAALQINGNNGSPAYGGLTPTRPAHVYNLEGNFAWKFNEHWFADAGFSYYHSLGSNRYDQLTLNFKNQPVPATTACNSLMVPADQCTLTRAFYLAPVPGSHKDRGVTDSLVTVGLNYIYRASAVVTLRAALPVAGRGAQFPAPYYVCSRQPCNADNEVQGSRQTAQLRGVQEAASVSASPYYELRFVFLLFAP